VYCPRVFLRRGCFALLVTALIALSGTRQLAARSVRTPPHPARVKTSGVVIEIKTTRIQMEANDPDILLEAKNEGSFPDGVKSPDISTDGTSGTDDPRDADRDDSRGGAVTLPLDDREWDPVCAPPCARRLPRTALFRVSGSRITTSATFNLPPDRPDVILRVKAGASRWYWTGVILTAFGGSLGLGGIGPPLLAGATFSTTGKVLAGAGAVMLAVGLPLWILNRTTIAIF
jgi:hypothetical protein